MKRTSIGQIMFWVGAVCLFVGSWLVMWWVAPVWRNSPPEQFDGTAWAFGGLIFMLIALSAPLGAMLAVIGILLYAESGKPRIWPFVVGGLLVALSLFLPPTLGYYPAVFGVSGGLMLVLFFAILWYWATKRRTLEGPAKTAADFQLVSYVFFLLVALQMCGLLGNPFAGLYFPEKVLQFNALPVLYSIGTKAVIYFALGWLFTFLSHHKAAQARV